MMVTPTKHRRNKKELKLIDKALEKLNDRLENVPEVPGKVTASSKDFPYIKEHVSVIMPEPKESTEIKNKIFEKEMQRKAVLSEIESVEEFVERLPDGLEKQIFEMVYMHDMTVEDTGEAVGYTKGRVSQIISERLNKLNI